MRTCPFDPTARLSAASAPDPTARSPFASQTGSVSRPGTQVDLAYIPAGDSIILRERHEHGSSLHFYQQTFVQRIGI